MSGNGWGLMDLFAAAPPDLGSISEEHRREVIKRADMDRYPTPPTGTKVPSLLMQRMRGHGGGDRSHWWKGKP